MAKLASSSNPNNYVFSPQARIAISEWLTQNVLVSWVPCDGDIRAVEKLLIRAERPLLNINGNPDKLPQLVALRRECIDIGRDRLAKVLPSRPGQASP